MTTLDGFALVESLRADPALATTAVLMLTALDDRASMRRGMKAGADDYLAKPFTRDELLEALHGLLQKSIRSAVQQREDYLRRAFTENLGGQPGDHAFGLAPDRALDVVQQIARALEVIHAHGIIHRDLKPENVMLRPDGSVALADFGVAKSMRMEDMLSLTQTRHGEVVGTRYYLSPEQASGGAITPASDLYSLGIMFYEMLAGERPFGGETLDLLLAPHLTAPTPQLPERLLGLRPVIARLMAKQAGDRYPSARALLDELERPELLRMLAG